MCPSQKKKLLKIPKGISLKNNNFIVVQRNSFCGFPLSSLAKFLVFTVFSFPIAKVLNPICFCVNLKISFTARAHK